MLYVHTRYMHFDRTGSENKNVRRRGQWKESSTASTYLLCCTVKPNLLYLLPNSWSTIYFVLAYLLAYFCGPNMNIITAASELKTTSQQINHKQRDTRDKKQTTYSTFTIILQHSKPRSSLAFDINYLPAERTRNHHTRAQT